MTSESKSSDSVQSAGGDLPDVPTDVWVPNSLPSAWVMHSNSIKGHVSAVVSNPSESEEMKEAPAESSENISLSPNYEDQWVMIVDDNVFNM